MHRYRVIITRQKQTWPTVWYTSNDRAACLLEAKAISSCPSVASAYVYDLTERSRLSLEGFTLMGATS